jgi:simple sugar transport system substrate-binding protein
VAFAIDQQHFLQGSIPIQVLTNYVRFGVAPSNSIFTGPGLLPKKTLKWLKNWRANSADRCRISE